MRKLVFGLCALAVALCCSLQTTEARPKYFAEFKKKYPDVAGLDEAKCNVCHEGKDKKDKNAYGIAYGTTLNAKNCKDSDLIVKALVDTEAKTNADGKSYGEILKGNQLP